MIPYLREKSFLDFVGAPEIDPEGYFVIRPEREEWAAWIASYRSRYSEKIVSGVIERGFMLTRSRWPEANDRDWDERFKAQNHRVPNSCPDLGERRSP